MKRRPAAVPGRRSSDAADGSHVRRLTQQGESWAQGGEAVQKRLTSAQADAAAEALRARVAHFMAAQQAAGQAGPGSMPAAADSQAAGMAESAIAAQPAMQLLPSPPEVSQLPSSAPGEPECPSYLDSTFLQNPSRELQLRRGTHTTLSFLY